MEADITMPQNNEPVGNKEPLNDEQICDDDLVENVEDAVSDTSLGNENESNSEEGDLSAAIKEAGLDDEPEMDDDEDSDDESDEDE